MADPSDDIFKSTILGMIFGIPILIGVSVLAIPFTIISCITGVPVGMIIQNLLIFVIAVFLVWLFSKFQIIENGIVALIVGTLVHTYFGWHPLACILTGVVIVGVLFGVSLIKIGFWIKTILFSVIVTFMVFMSLYSDAGLFPMSDKTWKNVFVIIFFLENILIRCSVAYNKELLVSKSGDYQPENHYGSGKKQFELATVQPGHNENEANNSTITEINNLVRKMNNEILKKQEDEESATYLMDHVYLFKQRKSFWDGNIENNIEEKIYQELKLFIEDAYLIIPHVAFREIFWWGDWWSDRKLTDRVTKMHFDFGIYNKELQPILFIEIQGKQHMEDPKVMERDKFKAEVMKRCGMKLITVDCSKPMTDQEIREKVTASIREAVPDRKACATYCPNCKSRGKNSLMIIKPNEKGTYFYGCSTYEEGKQDNCPGVSIEVIPPLYYGIPLFKE